MLIAFLLCIFSGPSDVHADSPVEALTRARGLILDNKLPEAEQLLQRADRLSTLKPWVNLNRGLLAEAQNQPDIAAKRYKEISPESAAGIEARVKLFRLSAVDPSNNKSLVSPSLEIAGSLEDTLRRAGREDLLPELHFAKGRYQLHVGDYTSAYQSFMKVRQLSPRSPFDAQAKDALSELKRSHPEASGSQTLSDTVSEIELLSREDELLTALELAQNTRGKFQKKEPGYYQALSAEEAVLRKMQRTREAENVLSVIAADGPPQVAAPALLRLARSAWNANDLARAQSLLTSFENRFAKSIERASDRALIIEARVMKARVLEEAGDKDSAREEYLSLSESEGAPRSDRVRALRRLAWLSLPSGDCSRASNILLKSRQLSKNWFNEIRTQVVALSNPTTTKPEVSPGARAQLFTDLSSARDELGSSAYWGLWCWTRSNKQSERIESAGAQSELIDLSQTLLASGSYYYMFRASELLGTETPSTLKSALYSFTERPTRTETGIPTVCTEPVPSSLKETLLAFENKAPDLARAEIDYFASKFGPSRLVLERITTTTGYKSLLTQAQLLSQYGMNRPALELLKGTLGLVDFGIGTLPNECRSAALEMSFPKPYLPLVLKAGSESAVDPALIYAISRTESSFDPVAKSRVGALGLMQLMPETAALEGFSGPDSNLLNPETNIPVGTKHLRRLKDLFPNSLVRIAGAYNGGITAVNRWEQRNPGLKDDAFAELISFSETAKYVKEVYAAYNIYKMGESK